MPAGICGSEDVHRARPSVVFTQYDALVFRAGVGRRDRHGGAARQSQSASVGDRTRPQNNALTAPDLRGPGQLPAGAIARHALFPVGEAPHPHRPVGTKTLVGNFYQSKLTEDVRGQLTSRIALHYLLPELTKVETESIIRHALGEEATDEMIEQIHQATGGNFC